MRALYIVDVYGMISDMPVTGKGRAGTSEPFVLQLQNRVSADAGSQADVSVKNTG